jgi:DNA-binding NarL/FixJ family response regulator
MMVQLNALQALLRTESRDVSLPPPSTPHQALPDIHTLQDGLTVLEQMTREALHQARSIDEDEPLAELIGVTFPEALSHAVEEMAERLGLSSRITFSGEERPLPGYTESLLYRIAQEALYQVQQHTGTRKLRLVLTYGHDEVQMSIEHDGVSATAVDDAAIPPFLPASHVTTDAVLSELRQRIQHLGGSLEVSTPTQEGQLSRIQARVPYTHHTRDAVGALSEACGAPFNPSRPSPIYRPTGSQSNPPGETDTVGADLSRPSPIYRPTTERVRVLVVEAQAVTRAGLHRLIESYPDLEVVGEAADSVQAVSETLELGPQVVLMDMQLPNGQSLEALRQIKQLNLNTQVLLLSALDREEYLYEALRAGAGGYVLKDIAPDELAQAVRTVARGEVLVHPQLARRLISQFSRQARGRDKSGTLSGGQVSYYPYEALTAREQEVLRLLVRGLRNKEMAARLHVSERTINFHLANIYQKLNVSGRTEALSKALEQGLITA